MAYGLPPAASTEAIAQGVGVCGLLNVQFALAADVLYVLEANPRASRTVPFVSKATAVPLAKAAARIAMGVSRQKRSGHLDDLAATLLLQSYLDALPTP